MRSFNPAHFTLDSVRSYRENRFWYWWGGSITGSAAREALREEVWRGRHRTARQDPAWLPPALGAALTLCRTEDANDPGHLGLPCPSVRTGTLTFAGRRRGPNAAYAAPRRRWWPDLRQLIARGRGQAASTERRP